MLLVSNILIDVRTQNVETELRVRLTPFSYSAVKSDVRFIHCRQATYFTDAIILAGMSTRCAVAKAICAESDTSSSILVGRLLSADLWKNPLTRASPLVGPGVSTRILVIVISTRCCNVSGNDAS